MGYFTAKKLKDNLDLYGERLEGGEIVDDKSLAKLYKEAFSSGRPLEIDPTIIRSTAYSAMRFFGVEEEVARKRSKIPNLPFPSKTEEHPII